jgi:hypothetical protein
MKSLYLAFFLIAVGSNAQQKRLEVELIAPEMLEQRVKSFPLTNDLRQSAAVSLFEGIACPKVELIPIGKKEFPASVLCIFPGENQKAILVGANFDKVKAGEGKIDNATGVVLLSALARALQKQPRRHTFVFAAFAEEEVGLKGSTALAKKGAQGIPPKQWLESLSAMVNIDSVGAGVTAVALSSSDKELAELAFQMAERLRLDFRAVNVDQVGYSDGQTFAKQKVRVVEFHSIDNSNFHVLHSDKDTMEAFRGQDYFAAYKLIAFYLAMLDQRLGQ